MREKPILMSAPMVRAILEGRKTETRRIAKLKLGNHPALIDCPYAVDRLWVKETFYHGDAWYTDPHVYEWKNCKRDGKATWVNYAATFEEKGEPRDFNWKPSIFMPRWASRINLNVLSVSVERLHEIDNIGASAEGTPDLRTMENGWDMRRCYLELWEQINGPGSWLANPWVWVVKFERVQP
jgi:hypothetical protein